MKKRRSSQSSMVQFCTLAVRTKSFFSTRCSPRYRAWNPCRRTERPVRWEDEMAKTAEYDLGEFTFPRGWFMVAEASELDNGPIGVRFFGQDFALYRGKSGRVVMLEAYCPHMGTHLAKNTSSYVVRDGGHVEGNSIRCPYHAWRFGPDGQCDDIPYSNKISKAACVKSWHVEEKAGAIFMWHDEEGLEPDFPLPDMWEWDDP